MSFIKSCLIYESFSDGSKFTDLVSNEIGIRDSLSRELLSKKPRLNTSENQTQPSNLQLEVHYRSNKIANRFSILFNNCRCVCLIGWLMRAKSFLTSYKNEENEVSGQNIDEEVKLPNETKLNLTNTDFLIVEDLMGSLSQQQAIMLRLTAFLEYNERRPERIVESCLQSVEVFACRMDAIEKTAVAIVDPMIVNILVNRKLINAPAMVNAEVTRSATNLDEFVAEISTDVLRMQVSYLDVYFFRRVFESIRKQLNGNHLIPLFFFQI